MNNNSDDFYQSESFQKFFKRSRRSLVLKADMPHFTILAVSDDYLALVHKQRHELLGKGLFKVFPGSGADPSEQFSVYSSFRRVLATGTADELPVFKYEIFVPKTGKQETYYWTNVNEPISAEGGKVDYIINATTNITEAIEQQNALKEALTQVAALKREQVLNEELVAINEKLSETQEELRALNSDLEQRVQQRTEQLAAANEEQVASNEELTAINEELLQTQEVLQQTNQGLEVSNMRFQSLVQEASVGIIVMTGDELRIEIVNKAYGRLIGRSTDQLLGQPLFAIIPETQAYFQPIINQVRHTGEPLYLNESPYTVIGDSGTINGYLDLVYQPYRPDGQSITGTIVLCHDVTEQVNARQEIADINERLNIAIEAGGLGYTEVDLNTGNMTCNEAFKRFYGRTGKDEFSYNDMFESMLPEYRDDIRSRVAMAKTEHSLYQATYEVKWPDGSIHWINAHGRARYDSQGNADRMVGIIADVTEQKQDEQRKSDFIGMVSHELKTPLTTLTAIVQVLNLKLKTIEEPFVPAALEKAAIQVKKMGSMINGFLNVSRLESGKIAVVKQNFDLEKLVGDVISEAAITTSSHNIKFSPCKPININADPDKIGSVISNFINNAVKYSPKGQEIVVKCVIEGNDAVISVKDDGIGINQQDADKIFERYYRVNSNDTKHIAGFGIGLYLSAEIIQRHNGQIWVESTIGNGSTFYFSVPLSDRKY